MKLTQETYQLIIDILTTEANNTEDEEYRKELMDAMDELDTIGIY